ncbi:MATE family efflux transporter [Gammaproteobacteria bacterium]|nr:MATE family efflux transporter [Gammaproteobacteria bacterium]
MKKLKNKDLTRGPIMSQLIRMAAPIMATSFIQMAYTLTDTAWVGRLGSKEVAAIGSIGLILWFVQTISRLTKIGAEVNISQSIGLKNDERARLYAGHCTTLSMTFSTIIGILLFTLAPFIVQIFKLEADVAHLAVIYLRVLSTSLPFWFLANTMTGIYNATGHTKVPFQISAFGLILNMILDPILIFGLDLGLYGAAFGTWIAQVSVLCVFMVRLKKDHLLDHFPLFVRFKRIYVAHILKIGAPVSAFSMLFSVVNIYLMRLASQTGGHIAITCLGTGSQIEAITWNTTQGFSTALNAFIGQNYVAHYYKRVVKALKSVMRLGIIFGTLTSLLFILFGEEIFSIFIPEKEAYIEGGKYLFILGFSQFFMSLEIIMQGVFFGLGKSTPPAVNSIVFNYIRIPLAILLVSLGMGTLGIWWSISISTMIKGLAIFFWFLIIQKRILNTEGFKRLGPNKHTSK